MKQGIDIQSIYNTYIDDLYSYAVYLGFDKELVMDAIHDVFCKLCAKQDALEHVENLKFYLLRSLKNSLINTRKQQKEQLPVSLLNNSLDAAANIEAQLIDEEDAHMVQQKIDEMLGCLTKKQHEIIYLRYVEGYHYNQIAALLHITPTSCRKLVHKAMQNIRSRYPTSLIFFLFI